MNIPIIDTHVHMDKRSANDYEMMAVSGVDTIIIPSTYSGEKRPSKEAYFNYFNKLITIEGERAKNFGIKLYVAVAVDPQDYHSSSIAYEVIKELPKFFKHKQVCALGEIGLENFTDGEINVFLEQLKLLKIHKIPAILHTPHDNKEENLPKMLKILDDAIEEYGIDRNLLLLDDLTVDTFNQAWSLNLGCYGLTVSPILNGLFVKHIKANPQEAKNIIDTYGIDKIAFNSALSWGFGDPLGISRVLLHLKMQGVSEKTLRKLAYENAKKFFSQSSNFKSQDD